MAPDALARLPPPRTVDLVMAGAITVVAQLETWLVGPGASRGAETLAALAMTLPLAWWRRAPAVVLVLAFATLHVMAAAGRPLESAYILLVLLVAFSGAGAFLPRRRALAAVLLGMGLLAALLVVENLVGTQADEAPAAGDFIFLGGLLGAAWGMAALLRDRSQRAGELERRAERLERDREAREQAVRGEERARIAQELHDVVAHSISVIAIQAGVIRRRLERGQPAQAERVAEIEHTARQALAEMRRMLELLRAEDAGPHLAPQPGLDQLDSLVEGTRRAGAGVDLAVTGERRALPAGVDLAAYRIVQEGLTNVLKHAQGAPATVEVRFGDSDLELSVRDGGAPAPRRTGGGHGLIGMRERATLYGGEVTAGPAEDGGWSVRARLPIPPP